MKTTSKTITNPMTLIALFSTLSETSAAISLPFLDDQDREYYIWFLITFPFYLLLLFFITLNFNYHALYSPSDFHKSKHFMKTLEDSLYRRKRLSRRPSRTRRPRGHLHRRRRTPVRGVSIVYSPSQRRLSTCWSKPSKHGRGHAGISVYVICRPRATANRQDG